VGSSDKAEGQKDFTTRTILTNITVLAIDQTLNETNRDEKSKAKPAAIGKTATLELDPRQAELLTAAEAAGALSLALRSTADNAEVAPVSAKVAVPSGNPIVVIVRGASMSVAPVAPKSP
jgi:pilus assembly protein CpaB